MKTKKIYLFSLSLMLLIPQMIALAIQPNDAVHEIMNQYYGSFDQENQCWHVKNIYCMKVVKRLVVHSNSQDRLYLIAVGNVQTKHSSALPSLMGLFLVTLNSSKPHIIAASPQIAVFIGIPTMSITPSFQDIQFKQLGPNDYWGVIFTTGGTAQGQTTTIYQIYAPLGKAFKNISDNLPAHFDNKGSNNPLRTDWDFSLLPMKFENTKTLYPLEMIISGKFKNKKLEEKKFVIPFDNQLKKYHSKFIIKYSLAHQDI